MEQSSVIADAHAPSTPPAAQTCSSSAAPSKPTTNTSEDTAMLDAPMPEELAQEKATENAKDAEMEDSPSTTAPESRKGDSPQCDVAKAVGASNDTATSKKDAASPSTVVATLSAKPKRSWADEMNEEAAKKSAASGGDSQPADSSFDPNIPPGKIAWQKWKDDGAPPCARCKEAKVNAKHPPPCDDTLHRDKVRRHTARVKSHARAEAAKATGQVKGAPRSRSGTHHFGGLRKPRQLLAVDQARNLLGFSRHAQSKIARELYQEAIDQVLEEAEAEEEAQQAKSGHEHGGGPEGDGERKEERSMYSSSRVVDHRPLPLRRRD